MRDYSYNLTEKQYNYLLPVLRPKLLEKSGKHFFIGTHSDYIDCLNRCKYL